MTTTKTVSAHGYRTEPQWLADQAHSTRWARIKANRCAAAMIISLCLFFAAIVAVAIETKNMIVWSS